ncbi:MAG: TVP38/TMEM64 family protein [Thermoanaerobaculia bacterium]
MTRDDDATAEKVPRTKLWLRATVWLAAVALIVALWFSPLRASVGTVATALEQLRGAWWAPLLFIATYAIANVLLFPATPLSLAAGVVWGWWAGGLWVLVASTIGSMFPYLIGRRGSDAVERMLRTRGGAGMLDALRKEGFVSLLLMRLVPLVPYNVLNYAAGFAGVRPRDYVLATFAGTIPGIFTFTYLADAIRMGVVSPRDALARVAVAGVLLGALIIGTRIFASRVRRRLD